MVWGRVQKKTKHNVTPEACTLTPNFHPFFPMHMCAIMQGPISNIFCTCTAPLCKHMRTHILCIRCSGLPFCVDWPMTTVRYCATQAACL